MKKRCQAQSDGILYWVIARGELGNGASVSNGLSSDIKKSREVTRDAGARAHALSCDTGRIYICRYAPSIILQICAGDTHLCFRRVSVAFRASRRDRSVFQEAETLRNHRSAICG